MHPNPAFRQTPDEANLAFARDRGFGMLCINADDGPLISHVPFVLSCDQRFADVHLVRSNPIARRKDLPLNAVLAVAGPDGYISPDWYDTENQVPTWNYVAVHLRGTLELRDPETLLPHLDELAATFEPRLAPKPEWTSAKMDGDALEKMLRMIVPARLTITACDGTWKLGQNKDTAARVGAAEALAATGFGSEVAAISALMRAFKPVE